jgi:hypothetical protein
VRLAGPLWPSRGGYFKTPPLAFNRPFGLSAASSSLILADAPPVSRSNVLSDLPRPHIAKFATDQAKKCGDVFKIGRHGNSLGATPRLRLLAHAVRSGCVADDQSAALSRASTILRCFAQKAIRCIVTAACRLIRNNATSC